MIVRHDTGFRVACDGCDARTVTTEATPNRAKLRARREGFIEVLHNGHNHHTCPACQDDPSSLSTLAREKMLAKLEPAYG